MSDFKEIAVRNRQNGVSGEQTGRDLFALSPNGPLEDVVEALAFAGFPPRDTIMGATQYSTSLYPGESEYTHRQVIIDKMKAVGYPANEVDDAVADMVAHDLHLEFLPALDAFLHQHLAGRGKLQALPHDGQKLVVVVRDGKSRK